MLLNVRAAVFGMGNVVYCALEIQNVMRSRAGCSEQYTYGWTYIPRMIFIVVQTFYLFKGTEVGSTTTTTTLMTLLSVLHWPT